MSIAVGIKCQNGLVVCADREMANADYRHYEAEIKAMVEATLTRYGRIDILVNNAGILIAKKEGRAHELTNEAWDRTMNVNLRGYWLCSKYVISSMLTQGSCGIFLIPSPTVMLGFPGITAYRTSKGGVFGLLRAMAVDYAPGHIRVNAIAPGTIDTPMNADDFAVPGGREKWAAAAPAGRLGVGDDIAGMALFLATEDADYCVGESTRSMEAKLLSSPAQG